MEQKPSNVDNPKSLPPIVDFADTKIAFALKSDKDLRKTARIFGMMNKPWLVNMGAHIGLWAVKNKLPFVEPIIRSTIFEQFVGGATLLECVPVIEKLWSSKVQSILDYGAERKDSEKDFNFTMNETIRSLEFAGTHQSVPVVSTKITGMARFEFLENIQNGVPLSKETSREYRNILKRLDSICHVANEQGCSIFFDAEESWIQDSIDHLVKLMMRRYNKKRAVVYNTYQMYRKDRLQRLFEDYSLARTQHYILGAKLVRGAYMEKERERALDMGYPSPIHDNKEATDDAYDTALRFCIDHYQKMASCNASHNAKSSLLQATLIDKRNIPRNHPNLNFCQLFGMSDNLTFNLAEAGYNVSKYLPYGQVEDVIPYLIRRAMENTSVTGDMSREAGLINSELKRRGLL